MKLGILSDCIHFTTRDGKVATENHIMLRQMEALAEKFDETLIACPFIPLDDKRVVTTYTSPKIKFHALPNVGGNKLADKLKLLSVFPQWLKSYQVISRFSDVVYMRFPNNLNIPGFFYFHFKKKKVFATYTGTWKAYSAEPATYRFQRWLLKNKFRGPVWAYIEPAEEKRNLLYGISPSYSRSDWEEETSQVQARIQRLAEHSISEIKMITVGTLIDYKNQLAILKACVILKEKNIPFSLLVVGDGPMRQTLEDFVKDHALSQEVQIVGKKNSDELRDLYRKSDFVVQAPLSEGFGKVPIEGFFHGVIPVINNIAMAKQMTGNQERGFLFDAHDPNDLSEMLMQLPGKRRQLSVMIENGRKYAITQTLENWADEYYAAVKKYFEAN